MLSAGSFKLCTVLQNQFHSARAMIYRQACIMSSGSSPAKKEDTGACAPVHLHLYPLPIMSDMPYMLFPGRYELRHTNPDSLGSIRIESE